MMLTNCRIQTSLRFIFLIHQVSTQPRSLGPPFGGPGGNKVVSRITVIRQVSNQPLSQGPPSRRTWEQGWYLMIVIHQVSII